MSNTQNANDTMVRNVTAFAGWEAMKKSLDEGYVPTIYGKTAAERKLKKFLFENGYKVWSGNNRRGRR